MLRFCWRNKDIKKSEREELVCFLTRAREEDGKRDESKGGRKTFIEANSDCIELSGKA